MIVVIVTDANIKDIPCYETVLLILTMLVIADVDDKSDYGKDIMIYNTTWNAEENDNLYDFEVVLMTEYHYINDNNNCGPDNKFDYEINSNDVDVMLLFSLRL